MRDRNIQLVSYIHCLYNKSLTNFEIVEKYALTKVTQLRLSQTAVSYKILSRIIVIQKFIPARVPTYSLNFMEHEGSILHSKDPTALCHIIPGQSLKFCALWFHLTLDITLNHNVRLHMSMYRLLLACLPISYAADTFIAYLM